MKETMKHHPAAELFPMLSDELLQKLADNIDKNGLIHPIVVIKDAILDGRNRYAACLLAGVKPRFVKYRGECNGSPVEYALSVNRERRDLTAAQKAAAAAAAIPLFEKEAQARMKSGKRDPSGKSSLGSKQDESNRAAAQAAKAAGAGVKATQAMKKIAESAPEVLELAKSGSLTVEDAKRIAALPEADRKEAVAMAREGNPVKKVIKHVADKANWILRAEKLGKDVSKKAASLEKTCTELYELCVENEADIRSPLLSLAKGQIVSALVAVEKVVDILGGEK